MHGAGLTTAGLFTSIYQQRAASSSRAFVIMQAARELIYNLDAGRSASNALIRRKLFGLSGLPIDGYLRTPHPSLDQSRTLEPSGQHHVRDRLCVEGGEPLREMFPQRRKFMIPVRKCVHEAHEHRCWYRSEEHTSELQSLAYL